MSDVAEVRFTNYREAVAAALDAVAAPQRLPADGLIVLKPNLTQAARPPVTTAVAFVEAVYEYCRRHSGAEIAVGEGCGKGRTCDVYEATGYGELARRRGLRLIDFNEGPAVALRRHDALQLKELCLPVAAGEAFIVSLPVLKDHRFTTTTIAMKNMFGLAPGRFYGGFWNKSKLHWPSVHRSIFDVCLYKPPGLCVVDASVALAGSHLSGTPTPLGVILAGFDPVAVDAVGSRLMGHDPHKIEYLRLANGVLGDMDDVRIVGRGRPVTPSRPTG